MESTHDKICRLGEQAANTLIAKNLPDMDPLDYLALWRTEFYSLCRENGL